MTTEQASIAVIGGGPSGLCLGALLQKQGIPFTVYELRDKPSDSMLSTPSGMLDLHEESGLAAIRACGLWEQFLPLTAECGESLVIIGKDGTVRHKDFGDLSYRPEIARNSLTHLLLSAVPAESVKWNHKLLEATRAASGKISLDFGDSGIKEHDFVVGADGAWSKIRPLLTGVKPYYGGVSYATLHILNATAKYPELAAMVGPGSCFILGNNNGLVTHRSVNDSISLHVSVADGDEHAMQNKTSDLTLAQLKDMLLGDPMLFAAWGGEIRHLLSTACDEEAALSGPQAPPLKPLYMLPVGHEWEAGRGAALIGDAAHLMMPWAGEGVNLAMWDALDLAAAITKAWKQANDAASLQEALLPYVAAFDREMFARSRVAAEETWSNSKILFSEDGAQAMADLMASFGPPPE